MQQQRTTAQSGKTKTSAKVATNGKTKNAATPATPATHRPPVATARTRAKGQEPHADLLKYRDEFPILSRKTYLNSCSLGPLSKRSMAAMDRFQELWNEYGAQAWYTLWMGEIAALRAKFARLIGAHTHEIAIATNVSSGLAEITTGLDLGQRNRVVLADMDFPTLAYQFLVKQRTGTEVVFVESPDGVTLPADLFKKHVNEQTGLVATSRVFYLSGYIQDIARLAKIAHDNGALLLVDDYQGTGQIPIDVHALDIDFLVTGTLKWLMGGPGLAFIYVKEDHIPKLNPTITGWFGARDQFQFRTRDFAFKDDATRLEAGTPAVAPIFAANAALDIVHEVGVERIRERSRFLADDLVRRAKEHGWKLHSPEDGAIRSSIVMLELDRPEEIVHALTERGIIVDNRPGLLRISPNFYNTLDENEQIITAIDELLRARG
ncbi:MAG TPA: aminotransferase class V-fold PLP-dependent enzyme [Ktedonobacterales bacterium]|nr:aminotransferase class V-fold PLP-dependent enzyme [Ktedonobacterales bacterium]